MALSNAERQKRYRQRRKVARCVTPEMIVRIARRLHEISRADDSSIPTWDEYCRSSKRYWLGNLPCDPDADFSDLGDDAESARMVAAVVRAVRFPPAEGC